MKSGYNDNSWDAWATIRWRGAVKSAIRGRRGQAFLRELLAALDALSQPRLIRNQLEQSGEVCAMGAIAKSRGLNSVLWDDSDFEFLARTFRVANALAAEILYINDHDFSWTDETPEQRFTRVRAWVVEALGEEGQT